MRKKKVSKKLGEKKRTVKSLYPELGAAPAWDHAIDRAHGRTSRDKQVGIKHAVRRPTNFENGRH